MVCSDISKDFMQTNTKVGLMCQYFFKNQDSQLPVLVPYSTVLQSSVFILMCNQNFHTREGMKCLYIA